MMSIAPIVIGNNGVPVFCNLTNGKHLLENNRLSEEQLENLMPILKKILSSSQNPEISGLAEDICILGTEFGFGKHLSEDLWTEVCDLFSQLITNEVRVIEGSDNLNYVAHDVFRFHRDWDGQRIIPTFVQIGLFNTFERALLHLNFLYFGM